MELHVRRMKPKPKVNVLDKKIKPNPKYKNMVPTLDTGNNLRKELERREEIQQFYKFRPDEVFRRININSLVSLMIEVNKLEYQLDEEIKTSDNDDTSIEILDAAIDAECDDLDDAGTVVDVDIKSLIHNQDPDGGRQVTTRSRVGTARTSASGRPMTSLTMGVGEMDAEEKGSVGEKDGGGGRPFLILDVREGELYERGHIALAKSYHHFRLSRAFNYETKEMISLKNHERSVIVVYDNDESDAARVATTLTQRGYDNVFMLSGGLRVAAIKYPESLVVDREMQRLEVGDIMVLESLLEENIAMGSSNAMSTAGSRMSTARMSSRGMMLDGGPVRTSTALGRRL